MDQENMPTPSQVFNEVARLEELFKEEVQDPNFAPGKMFGRYRIEKELGRGGMGIVYKAYDTKLKTFVALKVVIREEGTGSVERFLREASATAQLNHPNIVRFYEAGEIPKPYFTMEYIEGWTLTELIKEKKVKPLYLVDIMIKLCEALYLAHKNKILHRDIKPSNIMITRQGEPKIMDFGLAKLTKESIEQLSQSGQPLGTLLYMPPEQVEGKATVKSDIYSIGATIYEAITFRPVFQGENQMNLMYQILQQSPIPPRELNPDISPYLEAICLKCISKKPDKRYGDFKQLSRELKNFKAHRPLIAKKYSKWDSLGNFVHRNKIICIAMLVVFLVLIVSIVLITEAWRNSERETDKAKKGRDDTEQKKVQLKKALVDAKQERDQSDKLAITVTKALKIATFEHQSLFKNQKYLILFKEILKQTENTRFKNEFQPLRALILSRMENREDQRKSMKEFNNIIDNNPTNITTYMNRGILYDKQKKYKEAEKEFNKAIALNPKYALAYGNRGSSYYNQKKYRKAIQDWQKTIFLGYSRQKLLPLINKAKSMLNNRK